MRKFILLIIITFLFSCHNSAQNNKAQEMVINAEPIEVPIKNGKARAYFASGCFWCVEAIYESIEGVDEVINGYSGGHTKNPTYEASNTGRTGHAEAVEVIYDPKVINFSTLVDAYFASQNPTQVNGQGPDKGSQYRSIIFYQNDAQQNIIVEKKKALAEKLDAKIAAEVYPFQKFWVAEGYHQNYERLHPNNSYIRNISIPRLKRFQARFIKVLNGNELSHRVISESDIINKNYGLSFKISKYKYQKNNYKGFKKEELGDIQLTRVNAKKNLLNKYFALTLLNYENSCVLHFGSNIITEYNKKQITKTPIKYINEQGYVYEDIEIEDLYFDDIYNNRIFKIAKDSNNNYFLLERSHNNNQLINFSCIGKLELITEEKINEYASADFEFISDTPYEEISNPSGGFLSLDFSLFTGNFFKLIYFGSFKKAKEMDKHYEYIRYLYNQFLIEFSDKYPNNLPKNKIYKSYDITTTKVDGYGNESSDVQVSYSAWIEPKLANHFMHYGKSYHNYSGTRANMTQDVKKFFSKYTPQDPEFSQMYDRIKSYSNYISE